MGATSQRVKGFKYSENLWRSAAVIAALCGSLLLLIAGCMKLQDMDVFSAAISRHGVIPGYAVKWLSGLFVAIEVGIGAGLLTSLVLHTSSASRACAILAGFFLFIAAYCILLVWFPPNQPTSCGCGFSRVQVESWTGLAFRNGLAMSALVGLSIGTRRLSVADRE